jgi:hypothetical protein
LRQIAVDECLRTALDLEEKELLLRGYSLQNSLDVHRALEESERDEHFEPANLLLQVILGQLGNDLSALILQTEEEVVYLLLIVLLVIILPQVVWLILTKHVLRTPALHDAREVTLLGCAEFRRNNLLERHLLFGPYNYLI